MRNKIVFLILSILFLFSLVGCVNENKNNNKPNTQSEEKIEEFNVNFIVDGNIIKVVKVKKDNLVTINDLEDKEGYDFSGWYLEDTFINKVENSYKVIKNLNLYAKYEIEKYDVDFYDDDNKLFSYEINYNENIILKDPNQKEGYNFIGWFLEKEFINQVDKNYKVKKKINLYAKYEKIQDAGFQKYELKSISDNFKTKKDKVDLYNHNDVAYIGIKEFLETVEGIIDFNTKDKNQKYVSGDNITYDVYKYIKYEYSNNILILTYIADYISTVDSNDKDHEEETLKIDFINKKIVVSNYDFFFSILALEESSEDKLKLEFKETKIESTTAEEIEFNLVNYNIDILNKNNEIYLPLVLLNQMFLNEAGYQTYYNGDKVYIFDYNDVLGDGVDAAVKKSILTGEKLVESDIPNNLKKFQYNYYGFLFDYYYGIKLENNKSYKEFFKNYEKDILGNNEKHYKSTHQIINDLDDLHSSFVLSGYYKDTYDPDSNPISEKKRVSTYFKLFDKIEKYVENKNIFSYENRYTPDNKTAIIKFDDFDFDTTTKIKANLDEAKQKNVSNVVFDLTLNGGGIVGVAYEILGFMTDDFFQVNEYNPLNKRKTLDQVKSKYEKYNFKFYILTSPLSFSSGSMFPGLAKDNKIAKIIGYKTGGGASSITFAILPTGNIIQISSNNVYTNFSYNSTEFGVEPDILFSNNINTNYKKLFDLKYIQGIVNNN